MVVAVVLANVAFLCLGQVFDCSGILQEDADEILPAFRMVGAPRPLDGRYGTPGSDGGCAGTPAVGRIEMGTAVREAGIGGAWDATRQLFCAVCGGVAVLRIAT